MKSKGEAGAIILAAGYSKRMGAFKPLLNIGKTTAIEMLISAHREAGIKDIFVVTGHNREKLQGVIEKTKVIEVYNPDFGNGMFSSISAGIKGVLGGETKKRIGFFLSPVDCPLIDKKVLIRLQDYIQRNNLQEDFAVPSYMGKKGHPLWIPLWFAEELVDFKGDGGLKGAMKPYDSRLNKLETNSDNVLLDMDTPYGYEEIKKYYAAGERAEKRIDYKNITENPLFTQFKGRLFLLRHGNTKQHKEKIFLGQTDIALDEEGKIQASQAGDALKKLNINTNIIYTSDLSRATETAEIVATTLNEKIENPINVKQSQELREINLGEWDGKFISEIKEKYPREYEKRGKESISYKFGNNSENYYDLHYRTIKGLCRIFEEEKSISKEWDQPRDIIIVTHLGVIRMIMASLEKISLEEALEIKIQRGGMISWKDGGNK